MKRRIDAALQALVLIRIGQDLGHESKLALALHDLIRLLATVASSFLP